MRYFFLDASSPLAFGQAGDASHHQPFTWSTQMNLAARLPAMVAEMQAALAAWGALAEPAAGAKAPAGGGFRLAAGDRLGVCTGPGSLTGLRVALSFVRALALVRELPVVGIDLFTWGARTLEARGVRGPVRLLAPAFLGQAFLVDLDLPLPSSGDSGLGSADRPLAGTSESDGAPAGTGPTGAGATLSQHPRLGPRAGAPDGRPTFGLRFAAEGMARLDPEPAVLHELMLGAPAHTGWEALLRVAPLYVVPSQAELKWAQTHDHPGN
ncbi:MAG: hypothetical protein OZSIB_2753 [Candidatus Ozemobacter sibiricus]|jgi:hypothetical protein|uniref:Gcp-like domain-containing protein n=1 Tax=Candidatus Ozemobacter sibiricus TaxID=2268124 RepID=A0A367ZRU8_9BACT|nr:MAG: hypothetical protein OZSIB_2753 [Candidatus Ozemobacter sibiricus]